MNEFRKENDLYRHLIYLAFMLVKSEKTMAILDSAESRQKGVKMGILEAQKGAAVSLSY